MKDGRGQHMAKRALETRRKIKEYMKSNPDALKLDVCKAVGITYLTLRKHVEAIEKV
jgi:hypothetical protein